MVIVKLNFTFPPLPSVIAADETIGESRETNKLQLIGGSWSTEAKESVKSRCLWWENDSNKLFCIVHSGVLNYASKYNFSDVSARDPSGWKRLEVLRWKFTTASELFGVTKCHFL